MEQLDVVTIDPRGPLRIPRNEMPAEGHASKVYYRFRGGEDVHEVLLVCVAGALFALDSLCPHQGGRLAAGPLIDGENAHCPLHLYKFRPRDGQAVEMDCEPATTFALHEEGGFVVVEVGSSQEPEGAGS